MFGGQGPFANLRRGSLQEMDHIGVMRPITKYADAVYQTHRIPEYIELAIRHAVSGIPGPAYLEIPMDVFMAQVEDDQVHVPRIRTDPPRLSPDRDEVRRAIELLGPLCLREKDPDIQACNNAGLRPSSRIRASILGCWNTTPASTAFHIPATG